MLNDNLDKILELFELSETKIKDYEQITQDGIFIPSVNQLRYAGHHIVRFLANDNKKEQEKALNHIKRAIYDIDESLLIYYLTSAKAFKNQYNTSIFITDVIPDYIKLLTKLEKVNNKIQKLRHNKNNYENRELFYKNLSPYLSDLANIVAIFEQSVPLIVVKEKDKKKRDMIVKISIGIPAIIGIVALFFQGF